MSAFSLLIFFSFFSFSPPSAPERLCLLSEPLPLGEDLWDFSLPEPDPEVTFSFSLFLTEAESDLLESFSFFTVTAPSDFESDLESDLCFLDFSFSLSESTTNKITSIISYAHNELFRDLRSSVFENNSQPCIAKNIMPQTSIQIHTSLVKQRGIDSSSCLNTMFFGHNKMHGKVEERSHATSNSNNFTHGE